MATCDDFDGVYFTLTSLMIHHREVREDCNFVVVDNSPHSRQGQAVRAWVEGRVPNCTYHALPAPFGTAPARNEVFRQATGEFVLCIDCHVLLVPGAIRRLLEFFEAHPNCADLVTGPLVLDTGEVAATHQRNEWGGGAWGIWSIDERGRDANGEPFEIWQQGMGLFSCRRDAWVGFHPDFRGFGGCESYVMEKFRRRGGRVLCCPWLRWTHRFQRPLGIPYRVSRSDSRRNYLIGFRELGLDPEPMERHLAELARAPKRPSASEESDEFESSLVIFGEPRLGAVQMRGEVLAAHFQCPLRSSKTSLPGDRADVAIVVKECSPAVRDTADRLIYDPLDVFWNSSRGMGPKEFWRKKYDALHFDDIIATSPACEALLRESLPDRVRVHMIPHHSDSRINESWFNADGPIVYSGQPEFLSHGLDRVRSACRMLGKELVIGSSCEVLKGASLALALRLPPYDTPLNRMCKPQVKIANAIAANVPVVTTDCPAALTLYPGITSVPVNFTARQLAAAMRQAMQSERPWKPWRADNYLSAVNRLLGWPARIVFTSSYGNANAPVEPRERAPGVQYLCFTDNPRLKSKVWSFRVGAPSRNSLMDAKACKVLAHESLECDQSLWIESRVELQSLESAFEHLSADLALRRHSMRNCVYEEAERCKAIRRGDPSRIDRSIGRFREEAHPPGFGLWDTDVVLRRHNEITKAFNLEWWREVSTGTPQDQISLPVVLRRLSTPFETLPPHRPRTRGGNHLL
jgi:hypothetical protein